MQNELFVHLQKLMPKQLISRLAYYIAECKCNAIKNRLISFFIKRYNVNMSDAIISDEKQFLHFNDFFTRALKPELRPICQEQASIISPADGKISQIGSIQIGKLLQAKSLNCEVTALLGGNKNLGGKFENGSFATVYLSPKDYHRVHLPYSGKLIRMIHVPGDLFSVNAITTEKLPNLFGRNERVICLFETDIGLMALVLVGAMIVASIETVWAGTVAPNTRNISVFDYNGYRENNTTKLTFDKGEEVGRFKLGSTAIVLFQTNAISWLESAKPQQDVKMGEKIGVKKTTNTSL